VWLHADDSCLFSHGQGAFVTHLQPAAAAAAWDAQPAPAIRLPGASAPTAPPQQNTPSSEAVAAPTMMEGEPPSCLPPRAVATCPAAHGLPAVASCHRAELCRSAASGAPGSLVPGCCDLDGDAAGLVEGLIDASEVSRVYAASALPAMPVTTVVAAGSGPADIVSVPVGQVAAQALKFR
jgi:hypothetical protein